MYRVAKAMGLKGFVLNNGSNVEIHVDRNAEAFLKRLKAELPALARIDRAEFEDVDEELQDFTIAKSHDGVRVSLIPTDTAICRNCADDFRRKGDRRHHFPFTNCTECGARFTVIADLPFDRARTSMSEFPMCPSCTKEYASPDERRFHAQTISCPACGPTYTLYDRERSVRSRGEGTEAAFKEFSERIDEGGVGLLKGWGGMHIICTLSNASRLRKIYRRGDKPYAVMMRDLKTAKKYVLVSEREDQLLSSPQRPIVLLHKREDAHDELERVSPGLGNLGVILPYSGAHMVMFEHL